MDEIMTMQKNRSILRVSSDSAVYVLLVLISIMNWMTPAYCQSEDTQEYKIKAVLIYKTINFVDGWEFQEEENEGNNEPISIGIIGEDPFGDSFQPLVDKPVQDRKITIKHFVGFSQLKEQNDDVTSHPDLEEIKDCDILFVCSSEKQYITNILDPIRNDNILTVADVPGFLEKGGIMNFEVEDNKVQFDINTAAARRAMLNIRAKLLRLAKEVIEKDQVQES